MSGISYQVTIGGIHRTITRELHQALLLRGLPGASARQPELRKTSTHVQWRLVGDGDDEWQDLVSLADLAGDDGDDGLEVEMQKTSTHIQWRLTGGTWADLVALADLKGEPGATATPEYAESRRFPGGSAPAGWQLQGSVLSQSAYSATFAKVGLLHDWAGWTAAGINNGNSPTRIGYGNSRFVSVEFSRIKYSTNNGATWTESQKVAVEGGGSLTGTWRGCHYVASQDRWYAYGDNGAISTSDDGGETWSTRDGGLGAINYNGGCDCNGAALIVGSNGKIITSTDGSTYVERTSGTINQLNSAAYDATLGRAVAVGNTDTIVYSSDLATWATAVPVGSSGHIYDVARSDDWFLATAAGGRCFWSADGINWSAGYLTHQNQILIRVGTDGKNFLVGNYTNGSLWLVKEDLTVCPVARYASNMGGFGGITYGNGAWVVGGDNTNPTYRYVCAYATCGYNIATHFRLPSVALDAGVYADTYFYTGV